MGENGVPICDGCGQLCITGYVEIKGKHFCFPCIKRVAKAYRSRRQHPWLAHGRKPPAAKVVEPQEVKDA